MIGIMQSCVSANFFSTDGIMRDIAQVVSNLFETKYFIKRWVSRFYIINCKIATHKYDTVFSTVYRNLRYPTTTMLAMT